MLAQTEQREQFLKLVQDATRCWRINLSRYAEDRIVEALITHMRDMDLFVYAISKMVSILQEPRPLAASFVINGDRCLLLVGLFPKWIVRRNLNLHYYTETGRLYYAQAQAREPSARSVYYQSVINEFEDMARTLQIIRSQY